MTAPGAHKFCPACGQPSAVDAAFCAKCGHAFRTTFAPPPNQPPNQTQFFHGHPPPGYHQPPYPYQAAPDRNRFIVALLLCIFVGGLGIHRMYLGHTSSGVTMLMLSVIGVVTYLFCIGALLLMAVGIWALIDLILIATGNLGPTDGTRLV